ncbi:lipopolysaccharide kinase InaA family protein [Vibrio fluvialis]
MSDCRHNSGCRHLHQQGVMHGDLYAHNILITSSGDALLTDWCCIIF